MTQPAICNFKVMAVDDYGTRAFKAVTITVALEGMELPGAPQPLLRLPAERPPPLISRK